MKEKVVNKRIISESLEGQIKKYFPVMRNLMSDDEAKGRIKEIFETDPTRTSKSGEKLAGSFLRLYVEFLMDTSDPSIESFNKFLKYFKEYADMFKNLNFNNYGIKKIDINTIKNFDDLVEYIEDAKTKVEEIDEEGKSKEIAKYFPMVYKDDNWKVFFINDKEVAENLFDKEDGAIEKTNWCVFNGELYQDDYWSSYYKENKSLFMFYNIKENRTAKEKLIMAVVRFDGKFIRLVECNSLLNQPSRYTKKISNIIPKLKENVLKLEVNKNKVTSLVKKNFKGNKHLVKTEDLLKMFATEDIWIDFGSKEFKLLNRDVINKIIENKNAGNFTIERLEYDNNSALLKENKSKEIYLLLPTTRGFELQLENSDSADARNIESDITDVFDVFIPFCKYHSPKYDKKLNMYEEFSGFYEKNKEIFSMSMEEVFSLPGCEKIFLSEDIFIIKSFPDIKNFLFDGELPSWVNNIDFRPGTKIINPATMYYVAEGISQKKLCIVIERGAIFFLTKENILYSLWVNECRTHYLGILAEHINKRLSKDIFNNIINLRIGISHFDDNSVSSKKDIMLSYLYKIIGWKYDIKNMISLDEVLFDIFLSVFASYRANSNQKLVVTNNILEFIESDFRLSNNFDFEKIYSKEGYYGSFNLLMENDEDLLTEFSELCSIFTKITTDVSLSVYINDKTNDLEVKKYNKLKIYRVEVEDIENKEIAIKTDDCSKVIVDSSKNILFDFNDNEIELELGDVENIKIFNSKKIKIYRKKNIDTKEINMMLADVKDVYVDYDFIYKNDILNLYFADEDRNEENIIKSLKINIEEGEVVIKSINDDDVFA